MASRGYLLWTDEAGTVTVLRVLHHLGKGREDVTRVLGLPSTGAH